MSVSQGSTNMWVKVEFNGIAALSKRKFNPQKEANDRLCVELEHIEKETGRLLGTINSAGQLSTKNAFRTGDVLFGKLRPNLRKYIHCDFDGVCSSEIWVLNAQKKTNSHFLFYLIQQEKFIRSACITSGSKMPRADWAVVSEVPFPLPPLPEQKAIADLLSTWDKAIEKTERLIQAKEKRFQHTLTNLISYIENLDSTEYVELGKVLEYEQPIKYIVNSSDYVEDGNTPVLTANKSFILGYTNETDGIFGAMPVIIFDDFTTDSKFVDFPFKVKSSAMKILKPVSEIDLYLVYWLMSRLNVPLGGHKRYWISEYQFYEIPLPNLDIQNKVSEVLRQSQKEIDLLKSLAEKYKEQKRGLMQKLLTGEWRVRGFATNDEG